MKIGDRLIWIVNEFDTINPEKTPCIVTSVFEDHAIATTSDNITLWIDNDTIDQFKRS